MNKGTDKEDGQLDPDSAREARALALFADGLERPEGERHEWLASQCAGDSALLEAVLALVRSDEHASGFLETLGLYGTPVLETPALAREARLPLGPQAGDRVGAFELLEEIGVGGMGRVFRARRVDGDFHQEVAVKLLEGGRASEAMLARFHAERQILATLEHPAIARLIDGGEAADGTPFVVMELVRGQPITRHCNENGLTLSARLALVQEVCEGLEEAHRRGIVHRDIKPSNVLVSADGHPKIIDFGIAKVLDAGDFPALELPETATLQRVLTPDYASPEHVSGKPVGAASDVYSLGIMLYELLTGSRPYRVTSGSPAEIERTVCLSVPPDPSDRARRSLTKPPSGLGSGPKLQRALRGDVDRIVMKALRKEPEQRYPSALALGRDIERHLTGQPVAARRGSRVYRVRKFVERNRALTLAVTVVVTTLLVALLAVTHQAREAREAARKSAAVTEFLLEMIGQADPFGDRETPTLAGALRHATPKVADRFAGQPALEAEVRRAFGYAFSGLGEIALAREQLEASLAAARQSGESIATARALSGLGNVGWEESDYEGAREHYEAALDILAPLTTPEATRARFDVLVDFGGLLPKLEAYAEALDVNERALALAERLPPLPVRTQAVLWNNLANAHDGLEAYDQSIPAYERSIALHREAGSPHPDLAIALGNLGLTYEWVDRMDEAIAYTGEAAAMLRELLGPEHPEAVLYTYNVGSLQFNAGALEDAVENLAMAARGSAKAYPPGHLYIGRMNHRLAAAYVATAQRDAAREHVAIAGDAYAGRDDVPEKWLTDLASLRENLAD